MTRCGSGRGPRAVCHSGVPCRARATHSGGAGPAETGSESSLCRLTFLKPRGTKQRRHRSRLFSSKPKRSPFFSHLVYFSAHAHGIVLFLSQSTRVSQCASAYSSAWLGLFDICAATHGRSLRMAVSTCRHEHCVPWQMARARRRAGHRARGSLRADPAKASVRRHGGQK